MGDAVGRSAGASTVQTKAPSLTWLRCHFCNCRLSHERSAVSNACEKCAVVELGPQHPIITRVWQPYSVESQTVFASASLRYRTKTGEFYYTNSLVPNRAFRTRKEARAAAEV